MAAFADAARAESAAATASLPRIRLGPSTATAAVAVAVFAAAAAASTGGTYGSQPAEPDSVTCVSACAGIDAAAPGSVVRVGGDAMEQVTQVVFLGRKGRRDDVVVPAANPAPSTVDAVVPRNAVPGPIRVINADGHASKRVRRPLLIETGAGPAPSGPGPHIETRVDARKVFYGGRRRATLTLFLRDDQPANVAIELVRVDDGATIVRWALPGLAPRTVTTIEWDGTAGGSVQREGRYTFRLASGSAGPEGGATARSAGDAVQQGTSSFVLIRNRFPVQGPHDYGGSIARFGAPRHGYRHQGQDVFADCGTPLVAARGGTIKFTGFQSRAGNYVVIDGDGTGIDYVYDHLRAPALPALGDHIATGQLLGYVGDTGDATACHLHLELWTAPGWYSGGHPFNPLPSLKAWDASS